MPHEVLEHKYIKENPISGTAKALILGTIYPSKDTSEFMCDFFYGNEYTLWDILNDAFPKNDTFPGLGIYSFEEIKDGTFKKESAEKIKKMLAEHNIAISDTIIKTVREEGAGCSEDKFIKDKTVYNMDLVDQIKKYENIETIFFTSLEARRKFSHIYNESIKKLREEKDADHKNLYLDLQLKNQDKIGSLKSGDIFYIDKDKNYFKREIKGVILPSPSSRATGCDKHEEAKKETGIEYQDWRKDFYKREFGPYLG